MMRPLALLGALWLLPALLKASPLPLDPPHNLLAQVGSNYFGQTLGLSYSHRLLGQFWGNTGIRFGSFNLNLGPGESIFWLTNTTSYEYQAGLSLHWVASAALAFRFADQGEFRLSPSVAAGASFYDATFHIARQLPGFSLYQGSKDHSGFALYLEWVLLEYRPPKDRLFFSLGAKGNAAFLSSPQSIVIKDPSGNQSTLTLSTEDGSPIPFPYLEAFLGVGYALD